MMKALIVDDSMVMRKILVDTLSRAGILDVSQAGDGEQAVKLATSEPFDIILLDWHMPKMTGIEALKEMRARGLTMPIVMVTTEAEKVRIIEALQAGANSYIIKPFRAEEVAVKIQEILARV
jgi:two-component system chemotaxis response regulator CheY